LAQPVQLGVYVWNSVYTECRTFRYVVNRRT